MRFYLASWLGDGSEENPYRPSVGEGSWAGIDLRPDSAVQEGRVLVATPEPLASVPRGVLDVGELAESIPRGISRNLERVLGVTLDQFDSVQAIIAELLILHGDNRPRGTRTRWRPLKATSRGRHVIRMLGETIYEAPAPQLTTVTDDFNRVDSATLGGNWAEAFDNTHWEIVSNAAEIPTGSNARSTARLDDTLASDDHYAEFTLLNPSTATSAEEANPLTRFDASANTFYMGQCDIGGDTTTIFKREAGSFSSLTSGTHTYSDGDVVRMESDGSTQRLLINSVENLSTTDTAITGNVRTGMHGRRSTSIDIRVDDFEAADLGAATELTGTVSASVDIARAAAEEVEQLDGQADASLDVVGSLSQTQELGGTVQSAVQATGALTQTNELNGSVSTTIEATGSLTETEQLSGAAQTSVQATGALTQSQVLAGQSDVSISASGALTVEGTNELSGSVQTSISTTGALTVEGTNELAGTVSTSVSATGALAQTHEATGTNQAAIDATGSFTQINELAGLVSTSIETTGALAQTQELGGSADTSIQATGALTVEALADLQASLALAVGVTGALSQTQQLSQTLAQTLSVVGALKQLQEANAQARSQLQVAGALTVTQEVTRGSNGVTDALVGSIGLSESLVGTVGVADATAGNVGVSDG